MSTITTLDEDTIADVIAALERDLSKFEGLDRYDVGQIIDGVSYTLEYWGACPREQSVSIMEDYIRNPKKYADIKRGPPGRRRPDHGSSYTARLLCQLGRYEEALDMVEGDFAAGPGSAAPWLSKACALYGLGRKEEALGHAERSLGVKRDYHVAAGFKARILAGMGRYAEALRYAGDYQGGRDIPYFRAGIGLALAGLGRNEEALLHLRVAISITSNTEELEAAKTGIEMASDIAA